MIRRPPRSTLFPYRRSSDLWEQWMLFWNGVRFGEREPIFGRDVSYYVFELPLLQGVAGLDRKSTRLNSSHSQISYAVFCLKKKKNNEQQRKAARHQIHVGRA